MLMFLSERSFVLKLKVNIFQIPKNVYIFEHQGDHVVYKYKEYNLWISHMNQVKCNLWL